MHTVDAATCSSRGSAFGASMRLPQPYTASVVLSVLVLASIVGLLFGSFLNVCIVRLPEGASVVAPRSHCPVCLHPVRWYDNLPLLSFAVLRRRCRDCGIGIPWRYPAVEIATATWFVLSFYPLAGHLSRDLDSLLQLCLSCTAQACLGWLLLGLAVTDWRQHILPDEFTLGGIFFGLLFACAEAMLLGDNQDNIVLKHQININSANAGRSTGNIFLTGPEHVIFARVFAAAAAFLVLYLVRIGYRAVRKRDGMGLGDAKLLAMIAAFLGFQSTAVALGAGIFLATLYALLLLVQRRANAVTRLPFGSFLAAGGLLAAIFGRHLANAYLSLFP